MSLPINIEELVHGQTIEWERLEFKQGWNPQDVLHTMCAFANDINNWGGGYIILGVAETNGRPVLPPVGLDANDIDRTQGEIVRLAHRISPAYFPITAPYLISGQHILVLWCPAGDNRPYTAPTSLASGAQRQHYVRIGSRSIVAQGENLRRLQELTARIPFDDRVNHASTLDDLDLGLIREYLHEIKSTLFEESARMPFPDLCRTMHIAKGPTEDIRPVNVGLLFFSQNPEKFFNRTRIELVWHSDESGKQFKEVYFKGPIHRQLREALAFIQNNIIKEDVVKHPDKAESERFFNYPYDAIEEALSNAVYHKSYDYDSPIEIQIFPDRITILSHPGPVPPVTSQILSSQKRIIARDYRNRRIGDFLKELKLTEGRGTGFPAIYDAMARNNSPSPVFESDDATYVLVTIPARQVGNGAGNGASPLLFNTLDEIINFSNGAGNGAGNGARRAEDILANEIHDRVMVVLSLLQTRLKRAELFDKLGLSNQTKNRARYLDPLLDLGWVGKEKESDTDPNQRYFTTSTGLRVLQLQSP